MSAQSTQGGWYDTSRAEGHDFATISSTAIQVQALQAAENAGIPVPVGAIHDAKECLKTMVAKAQPTGQRSEDVAAALVCLLESTRLRFAREIHSGEPKDELNKKLFKRCETEIPMGRDLKFGRDELAHFYFAQAQYDRGGDAWKNYRTALFDELKDRQKSDGSWPPGDGICVGPVYSTALWCTVLQLDRRTHPSTRHDEVLIVTERRSLRSPVSRLVKKFIGESKA